MRAKFRLSDLIAAWLTVEAVHDATDAVVVDSYGRFTIAVRRYSPSDSARSGAPP